MVFHQKLCGTSKMRETRFWFAKREVDMTMTLERLKFTVEDYYKLVVAGILHEGSRVELINGELITVSPKNIIHNQLGNDIFGDMMCFRGNKAAYLEVTTKSEFFKVMPTYTDRVQETYL